MATNGVNRSNNRVTNLHNQLFLEFKKVLDKVPS